MDELFSQWNNSHSPGCALAVVKDGEIIYNRGYGMADLEHHIPITSESVFYIGSVSKQFVTMCIMLLEKDVFRSRAKFKFQRDENGQVKEFILDAGRVTNLRFVKQE